MCYTDEEREEAAYELWLIQGGPEKEQVKQQVAARLAIAEIETKTSWRVLSEDMVREAFTDYAVLEVVVRKGDQIRLLRWKPFNKGFMEKLDYGWGIFYPDGAPIRKSA